MTLILAVWAVLLIALLVISGALIVWGEISSYRRHRRLWCD